MPSLICIAQPRSDTFSLLFGFVSIDMLASCVDVILNCYEKVSTQPNSVSSFHPSIFKGDILCFWGFSLFFGVLYSSFCACQMSANYQPKVQAKGNNSLLPKTLLLNCLKHLVSVVQRLLRNLSTSLSNTAPLSFGIVLYLDESLAYLAVCHCYM